MPFPPGAVRRALLLFLLSFVLTAAIYRHTPMNFLRAESGWYLQLSHSSEEVQRAFKHDFFTTSYGGHYAPLAFLAEFETAKIVGTNASFWKWRQILAVAIVGAMLAGAVSAIGGVFQFTAAARWALSAAITGGAIFRAEMVEFISWPFMILQLIWAGLFILALSSVVKTVTAPDQTRWPWIAAAAACGSMQVSGLGLITVVAVAIVFSGILFVASRRPSSIKTPAAKQIRRALLAMLALGAVHGWAMLYLSPTGPSVPTPSRALAKLFLGFTANLAVAAVETFSGTTISRPDSNALAYSWPQGLLVIAAALLLVACLLRKALKEPTPQRLIRFALHAFSIAGFLTMIGLIVARQLRATSPDAVALYLSYSAAVSRYLVPLHLIVIAAAIELVARLIRAAPRFTPVALWAIALAAVVAQDDFRKTTFGYVAPLGRISHQSAWGLLLATVQECRAANLPVPNFPLAALTQEFGNSDTGSFEPLLRHDLQLKPGEKIELLSWEKYRAGPRERYRSLPSLGLLEKKLNLPRD